MAMGEWDTLLRCCTAAAAIVVMASQPRADRYQGRSFSLQFKIRKTKCKNGNNVKNQGKTGRKQALHHMAPFCLKLNPKWWTPNHWLITGPNWLIRRCCKNESECVWDTPVTASQCSSSPASSGQAPLQAPGSALCFVLRCLLHAWRQLMRQIRGIS